MSFSTDSRKRSLMEASSAASGSHSPTHSSTSLAAYHQHLQAQLNAAHLHQLAAAQQPPAAPQAPQLVGPVAWQQQVLQGTRGAHASTSKFRGVCWNKKNKRWQASINSQGKYIYLGSFPEEIDAAKTFDLVALKMRGPSAKINFGVEQYLDSSGNLLPNEHLDSIVRQHQLERTQAAAAAAVAAAASAGDAAVPAAHVAGDTPHAASSRPAKRRSCNSMPAASRTAGTGTDAAAGATAEALSELLSRQLAEKLFANQREEEAIQERLIHELLMAMPEGLQQQQQMQQQQGSHAVPARSLSPPPAEPRAASPALSNAAPAAADADSTATTPGVISISWLLQQLPSGYRLDALVPGPSGLLGTLCVAVTAGLPGPWRADVWDTLMWHNVGCYSSAEEARLSCCYVLDAGASAFADDNGDSQGSD